MRFRHLNLPRTTPGFTPFYPRRPRVVLAEKHVCRDSPTMSGDLDQWILTTLREEATRTEKERVCTSSPLAVWPPLSGARWNGSAPDRGWRCLEEVYPDAPWIGEENMTGN